MYTKEANGWPISDLSFRPRASAEAEALLFVVSLWLLYAMRFEDGVTQAAQPKRTGRAKLRMATRFMKILTQYRTILNVNRNADA